VEQTIPIIMLFGVMGALFNLNKRSELIVLRASGWSAWRFLRPVVMIAISVGVIWSTVFNPLAEISMQKHYALLSSFSPISAQNKKVEEIWLREGSEGEQIVITGTRNAKNPSKLDKVTFYYFETTDMNTSNLDEKNFLRRLDAETATLLPTGYWRITSLAENQLSASPVLAQYASIPTNLKQSDIDNANTSNLKPTFWKSLPAIRKAERAGFSTVPLRMNWHKQLALPFMLIAMTFIAASVSIHLSRQGGTLQLMVSGALIGFFVYFVNTVMSAFGEAQTMPVILSAWSVPLLALLFGVAYLAKIEDG